MESVSPGLSAPIPNIRLGRRGATGVRPDVYSAGAYDASHPPAADHPPSSMELVLELFDPVLPFQLLKLHSLT